VVLSSSFYFEMLFTTLDQKEGMQAFVEKRNPNFKDDNYRPRHSAWNNRCHSLILVGLHDNWTRV